MSIEQRKILGFTLAEMLIALIMVSVLTVASIPVIQKSKLLREKGKDKNSWAAMYEGNELAVYKNGQRFTYSTSPSDFVDPNTPKFIPPAGVNKFNVTVVGGGGGGAAGTSLAGFSKKFFAANNAEDYNFIPPNDGLYRIVAIGGGGGGAGGAVFNGGEAGHSAGGVVVTARLSKHDEYGVMVGMGGAQGMEKDFGDAVLMEIGLLSKIAMMAGVALVCPTLAAAMTSSMIGSAVSKVVSTVATEAISAGSSGSTPSSGSTTTVSADGIGDDIYLIDNENVGDLDDWWDMTSNSHDALDECVVVADASKGNTQGAIKQFFTDNKDITPGLITLGIGAISYGLSKWLAPSEDWLEGGGHGLSTAIVGGPKPGPGETLETRLNIVAGGGAGGRYRKGRLFGGPQAVGRSAVKDDDSQTYVTGTSIIKSGTSVMKANSDKKTRFFCVDGDKEKSSYGKLLTSSAKKSFCKSLDETIDGGLSEATSFGDGGRGGNKSAKGRRGSDGYAEFTEINAYGGGGGQAGSVSIHTFDRSPVSSNCGDACYIAVTVGKGGQGGLVSTKDALVTANKQRGQDGGYSSFGGKIVASGGEGGILKAVEATPYENDAEYRASGQDGMAPAFTTKQLTSAGVNNFTAKLFKGYENKDGEGSSSTVIGFPGLGGAGGAGYAKYITKENKAYYGGNGSSGIVLVTW